MHLNRRDFITRSGALALLTTGWTVGARSDETIAPKTSEQFEDLKRELEELIPLVMEREGVPGLSIAVLRDGEVAWAKGFGVSDLATAEPVDEHTVFQTASITKPVFAYVVLKACEKGILDLDDRLVDLLPSPFKVTPEKRLKQMRVRHVLTHTTGLPNNPNPNDIYRIQSEPGKKFEYSGEGFLYLQLILEHLTGEDMATYTKKHLFDPLGMTSSSMVWRADLESRYASGHSADKRLIGMRRKFMRADMRGTMESTPSDYARFMGALMRPPEANDHFLSKVSIAAMMKPQIEARGGWWGLGWGLRGTVTGQKFIHQGDNRNLYTCAAIGFLPEGIGAVVFTNSGAGRQAYPDIMRASYGRDQPALQAW